MGRRYVRRSRPARVAPAPMEHHFTGPELHARHRGGADDRRRRDARPRQRDRDAARGAPPTGEIKPELMESVLEIATDPCADTAEAGEQLRALRAPGRASAARATGLTIGSAGTHPFAMWEDQRIVARAALPRPRSPRCASSPARSSSSACTCTSASTTPTRRSTSPTGCASTSRCCWRCQRQLAVLARRRDRPAVDAHADLPRVPARRHPAGLPRLGRLQRADRVHGRAAA